jgi:GNAT superfamily N-acetyltransferase
LGNYQITLEVNPAEEDVEYLMRQFNAYDDVQDEGESLTLGAFMRGDHQELLAGVYGTLAGGWLFIDVLWVHEQLRGQDYGTKFLQMIEQAAVARGVNRVYLGTADYQARPFYEKQGYEVAATALGTDVGHTSWLMKKENIAPRDFDYGITVQVQPNDEDVRELTDSLKQFNEMYVSGMPTDWLAALVRDGAKHIVGGVIGSLAAYSVTIRAVWMEEALRGQGYEARLLDIVEREAAARQSDNALAGLTGQKTIDFLQRHGYHIESKMEDCPAGYTTYYLLKPLTTR